MMKNTKKLLMAGMMSLSMICSGGLLVGCSNTSTTTTTETTKKKAETKTIGEKTEDSKSLKIVNKTGKGITVFETKSSSDESFSENLLTDGDVVKKDESRVLYYETKENDTLSIKVGLKDSDSTFTFDKVDETEKIKDVEIILNDDEKVELTVHKKDDSQIKIEATADEVKSEDEKENEEDADTTSKVEESKSDSNESKTETKTDKTASTSSKSENKTASTNTNTSTSNKSNSSSNTNSSNSNKNNGSSSSSEHTHNWVAQTKVIHHDAQYTTKYVVDQAAYDEQVAQTEMVEHTICSVCEADLSSFTQSQINSHMKAEALAGKGSGYYSKATLDVVGYTTIHHDEVGHNEQVLVKEAYDETVTTGYKCSTCGKTK